MNTLPIFPIPFTADFCSGLDALHPAVYQLLLLQYQKTAAQSWRGPHATHGDQPPMSDKLSSPLRGINLLA
jgi:hypothetical protein